MINLSRLVLRFLIPSITAVLLGVAVHAGQGAQANPSEEVLARLFDTAAAEGQVRVIVGLRLPNGFTVEGHLPNARAVANQRNAIARKREDVLFGLFGLGAEVYASWDQVPYVAMKVAEPALEHLINSPLVTSIEEDSLSFPSLVSATAHIGSDVTAASGFRGAGQTVVILDTGIDTDHPFFGGRVVWQECRSAGGTGATLCPDGTNSQSGPGAADVTDGAGNPIAACDDGGGNQICDHGVHVAGIAAGEDDPANPQGPFDGVAPDANIIPIQVFSRFTGAANCNPNPSPCVKTSLSDQLSAFNVIIVTLANLWDISSVNMSLGGGDNPGNCDGTEPARKAAIDALRAIDIATVIAAGNNGWTDAMGAPGCISTAVTVGSVFDASTVTPDGVLHNMDAGVDLLAVGSGVISSVPDDAYGSKGGTSMATPQVTGAFAVIASIDPSLTVDEIEDLLKATGVLVTDLRAISPSPSQVGPPITAISGYVTPRLQLDAAVAALVGEADLRVLKDCKPDQPVLAGTTVTCTIFVDNLGPSPALNVVAVDEYLSDGTFDFDSISTTVGSCSNTPNPQNGAGTIICELGNMAISAAAGAFGKLQSGVVVPSVPRLGLDVRQMVGEELERRSGSMPAWIAESELAEGSNGSNLLGIRFVWIPG